MGRSSPCIHLLPSSSFSIVFTFPVSPLSSLLPALPTSVLQGPQFSSLLTMHLTSTLLLVLPSLSLLQGPQSSSSLYNTFTFFPFSVLLPSSLHHVTSFFSVLPLSPRSHFGTTVSSIVTNKSVTLVSSFDQSQQIPHLLWNQNVHCRVHKSPTPIPTMRQNTVLSLLPQFLNVCLNITLPSMSACSKQSLPFRFPS
jgi:hypothetical protein